MNFRHKWIEPFPINFRNTGTVDFSYFSSVAKLFYPSTNDILIDSLKFLSIQWIVELSVQSTAVLHELIQCLWRVGYGGFIGVIFLELFSGHLRSQTTGSHESPQYLRVDVFNQEGTRFHRHEVFKRRHVQTHTES